MRLPIVISLMLAGCASVQGTYGSSVDETAETAKPLQDVSACLQTLWGFPPITMTGGETAFPVRNGYGSILSMITLRADGETTIVERRGNFPLLAGGDWRTCL